MFCMWIWLKLIFCANSNAVSNGKYSFGPFVHLVSGLFFYFISLLHNVIIVYMCTMCVCLSIFVFSFPLHWFRWRNINLPRFSCSWANKKKVPAAIVNAGTFIWNQRNKTNVNFSNPVLQRQRKVKYYVCKTLLSEQ